MKQFTASPLCSLGIGLLPPYLAAGRWSACRVHLFYKLSPHVTFNSPHLWLHDIESNNTFITVFFPASHGFFFRTQRDLLSLKRIAMAVIASVFHKFGWNTLFGTTFSHRWLLLLWCGEMGTMKEDYKSTKRTCEQKWSIWCTQESLWRRGRNILSV